MSSTPPGPPSLEQGEVRLELAVYGMRCQGCATALTLGLGEVAGVRQVEVDVAGNRIAVVGHTALQAKVEELGYRLTPRRSLLQGWRRVGRAAR